MRRLCQAFTLAAALAAGAGAADDGKPTLVQIGRLGKAATALVECDVRGGKSHGSAFCVHPSGLFVTNEHVVRDGSAVRLVLGPSLRSQKVVKAEVVRVDRERDLALLRAVGTKGLPALELGTTDGIEELMEVIAFGFPFGKALTVARDDYPAVSVNRGTITSLRRLRGELHRIQVDVALNPGNSGGPLLDPHGKVVGVVVSGVRGSGVNFVIPVGHVSRFLEKPDVSFAVPKVAAGAAGKATVFEARAVPLVPAGKVPDLELVLTVGGKERRFPMKRDGDVYRAVAVPLPAVEGPVSVRATLAYADGSVSGMVLDRPVKIAGKDRRLSEVRVIRRLPTAAVELRDGTTAAGWPAGLDSLEVTLGGKSVRFDLTGVSSVAAESNEPPASVACAVLAKVGGKVVAEVSESLALASASGPSRAPPGRPVAAPRLEGEKVTRTLPSAVSDAVMAGGGRYLLLPMPRLRRLAIFDVSLAKVTGYIPLAGDNVRIAGGQSKVIVVLPDNDVIQRWDLATQKRELAIPLVLKGKHKVQHVAMGCASEGPVVITAADFPSSGEVLVLGLGTLKPLPLRVPVTVLPSRPDSPIRASADGRVFGTFCYGQSPQEVRSMVIEGGEAKAYGNRDSVGHITPGDDGRFLYTSRGIYSSQAKALGTVGRDALYCLPAVRGPYYLGMRINGEGAEGKHRAQLFLAGDARPLATVKDVDWPEKMNEWDRERFAWDRRIWLVPEAKVLLTIPAGLDKVVLHRLDVDAAIEKSGIDFLVVTSRPPPAARKGAAFTYPLRVKSKKGGVKYELSSGPKGMEVTKDGVVRWAVPAGGDEKTVDVIVTVGDASGQETFHTFTLRIE